MKKEQPEKILELKKQISRKPKWCWALAASKNLSRLSLKNLPADLVRIFRTDFPLYMAVTWQEREWKMMTHEERIRLDEETEQVEELINLAKLQVWELIGEYLKDRLGKFSEKDLNDYSHVFSYILPNLFSRYVEKQRKMIYDLGGKEE